MNQEEAIQEEELQREAAEAQDEAVQEEPEAKAEEEQEPSSEASKEPKEKSEKSFLGKKKKKKDPKDEKIEELEDRVKRQMAEFDNFRKRTEKEKSHMYEIGARGLAAVPEEERANPVIEGMDKIYKQLMTVLTDLGVAPIEAAGQEFDPNLHNAVMHIEDEELGENIVAEEFQKGYTYKETVIRHSMVKVAN